MKTLVGMVVGACLFAVPAQSQDYKAEIETHVTEPCFKYMILNNEVWKDLGMTHEQTLDFVKEMLADHVKNIERAVIPVVRGKSFKTRKVVYTFAAGNCIKGAKKTLP